MIPLVVDKGLQAFGRDPWWVVGLKVLFMTGYAENAAVGNGHLEPGMQVLTKPFVMEVLASRIREMIEGHRGSE